MEKIIKPIFVDDDELDLNVMHQQTLSYSEGYEHRYIEQHQIESDGFTSEHAKSLACSRLQWTYQMVRPTLAGTFSESDFATLLDCYQGDLFFPDQFSSMASDLCDHLGIDLKDDGSSEIKMLLDKLLAVQPVQKMAMADAVEQIWHRGLKSGMSIPEFLETLGIQLAREN
jgi:hypothetical protein